MEKELYKQYVKDWEEYKERSSEYYEKRLEIIKKYKNSESFEEEEKELNILKKEYGWDGFNPYQFGPWTIIDDPQDLRNSEFKLPGLNKAYCESNHYIEDLPNWFGLIAEDDLSKNNKGIIIGYGYDATDDYLVIKKSDGETSTIIMNSRYKVIGKNGELLHK